MSASKLLAGLYMFWTVSFVYRKLCKKSVEVPRVIFECRKACSRPEEVGRGCLEYCKPCSWFGESVLITTPRIRGLLRFVESVLSIAKLVVGM